MTIRKLFPLLLVAVAAAVLVPERASAQCWYCDECWLGPTGTTCVMELPGPVIGNDDCDQTAECKCEIGGIGFCFPPSTAAEQAEYETELAETVAAIKANRSIPSDGRFFYVRRGAEFVVRSKCDVAEVDRVAIAEIETVPVLGAG